MASVNIAPISKQQRTPLIGDVVVTLTQDATRPDNLNPPPFGTPYNSMTGAPKVSFPDHKFAWREGPTTGRDGSVTYTLFFVADLPTQHLYNYEISDEPQWPRITQSFVVPRATYVANPADPATLYPPPPDAVVSPTGYSITSLTEVRTDNQMVDSLYVVVQVVREKIDQPVTWAVFDPDTGTIRNPTSKKVVAGTPGAAINENGAFQETQVLNSKWSLLNTEYAAGLAGSATDGVSSRTYQLSIDYYWPPVLAYINIQRVTIDPSDAFSETTGYIVSPVWLADQYNGPCKATMVETWYKEVPPDTEPTILLPDDIEFTGPNLSVNIPRCLHGLINIFDSGYNQYFFPTTPQFWPRSMVVSVDVKPQFGGWLQRVLSIDAPSIAGTSSGLVLEVSDSDYESFTLGWTPESPATHTTSVFVSSNPSFETGFLPGFNGQTVAAGTDSIVVTGALQNRYYYAKVVRDGVTSNVVVCGVLPSPIIAVSNSGITLDSGDVVNVGSTAPESTLTTTITITNRGSLVLSNLATEIVGGNEDSFNVSSPLLPSLSPGQSTTFTVQFSPTTGGIQDVEVNITSDASNVDPFVLTFSGEGITAVLQLENPLDTIIPSGDTFDFGSISPVTEVFYIRNVGSANATSIEATITGDNASDFTITSPIVDTTLAPTGVTQFSVEFDPVVDPESPNTRVATLTVTSNAGTYSINITGIYDSPLAPGAADPSFSISCNGSIYAITQLPSGDIIAGGSFTMIGGQSLTNLAKISAFGAVDPSFSPNPDGSVLCIAAQEDGKIIVGGEFTVIAGGDGQRIARLNSDGTFDSSFTCALDREVNCIAIRSDGKILVGGDFTLVNGVAREYLARLETNGTTDTTFNSEVNGPVYGVEVLTDSRIFVVGNWIGGSTTAPPTTTPPVTTGTTSSTTVPPTTSSPPTTSPPPTTPPPTTSTAVPTTSTPVTTPPPTTSPPTTPPPTTAPPPPTTTPPP